LREVLLLDPKSYHLFLAKDLIESHGNHFDNPRVIEIFGKLVNITWRKKGKDSGEAKLHPFHLKYHLYVGLQSTR
jgi:hypothetical protein